MKVIFEMTLRDVESPHYALRSAALLEKMAAALRAEIAGGPVVSKPNGKVEIFEESLVHVWMIP